MCRKTQFEKEKEDIIKLNLELCKVEKQYESYKSVLGDITARQIKDRLIEAQGKNFLGKVKAFYGCVSLMYDSQKLTHGRIKSIKVSIGEVKKIEISLPI